MKVRLLASTLFADRVCAVAARTCMSSEVPRMFLEDGDPAAELLEWSLRGAIASGHESVLEHATFTFAVSGVSRALSH